MVYIWSGMEFFRKNLSVIFNVQIKINNLNVIRIGINFSIDLVCYDNDSRVLMVYIVSKMKFIQKNCIGAFG